MASWIAAATSYATRGVPMVPFYSFYSMFGFQRVGDLIWSAADSRARGLPAGGHRRAHHPARRRAAAPGRAQPAARLDRPGLPGVRPGVRLRDGGHRPRRAAPHVRRQRGHLLLPHPVQRELPDACRSRRGSTTGILQGMYRWADGPRGDAARRHHRVLRVGPRCRPPGAAGPRRALRGGGRRSTAPPRTSGCARRRSRRSGGTVSIPEDAPRVPLRHPVARRERRAGDRRLRLHEGGARPGRPLGAAAGSDRWAPTASAAATPARRCAGSSRSTPPTPWWPRWRRWRRTGRSRRRWWATPSNGTNSTPTSPTPGSTGLSDCLQPNFERFSSLCDAKCSRFAPVTPAGRRTRTPR